MKEILQNILSETCLSLVCRTLAKHNKALNNIVEVWLYGNRLCLFVKNDPKDYNANVIVIDLSTGCEV